MAADEAEATPGFGVGNIWSIAKKAIETYEKLQRRSESESLGEVRRQNNFCLHLSTGVPVHKVH